MTETATVERPILKVRKNDDKFLSPYGQRLSLIFAQGGEQVILMREYVEYPELRPFITVKESADGKQIEYLKIKNEEKYQEAKKKLNILKV